MSKQDRQGARTSADLEQKYRFGRYFSEQEKENARQNKEMDQQNMTLRDFISIASSTMDSLQKDLTAANKTIQELLAKDEALEKTLEESNSSLSSQITKYWETVYPVGSIYISLSDKRPENLFGGEWIRIEDRFLLASGSIYGAGTTGGEAAHTLTVEEMPKHSHQGLFWSNFNNAIGLNDGTATALELTFNQNGAANSFVTGEAGDSKPHNNMPPYLAVRVWQRTA